MAKRKEAISRTATIVGLLFFVLVGALTGLLAETEPLMAVALLALTVGIVIGFTAGAALISAYAAVKIEESIERAKGEIHGEEI
jgi:nucleoside recognition membrane protein YjiH